MRNTASIKEVLESMESLDIDSQAYLLEVLSKRLVDLRRLEIAERAKEAEQAYRKGKVKSSTVNDLCIWDEKFMSIYKKWSNKHPDLVNLFRDKLDLFANYPFHPSLKTHPLSGILKGLWSSRINHEHKLIFKFVDNEKKKVLLIDIGTVMVQYIGNSCLIAFPIVF